MLLIFFHVFLKDVQVGYEYRSRYMPISKAMKWNMIKLWPFFHKIKTSPDTETTLQSPSYEPSLWPNWKSDKLDSYTRTEHPARALIHFLWTWSFGGTNTWILYQFILLIGKLFTFNGQTDFCPLIETPVYSFIELWYWL